MDKIREALNRFHWADFGAEECAFAEERGKIYSADWHEALGFLAGYRAALSAPVASDARELIREIERDSVAIHRTGAYKAAQLAEDNAVMKTETYVAEQERKAREEEREACAERAVTWQKALCKADDWPCRTCTECDQLRAAIKEAGNGKERA